MASRTRRTLKLVTATLLLAAGCAGALAQQRLLNASYDVSREFYREINPAFIRHYEESTGKSVSVNQAHGGSSMQARAVREGLQADVVTMNTTTDVQYLADNGMVSEDWQSSFPYGAAPTTSTMLFLVRKGNPKNIRDWGDLVREGVQVIAINPKTGGNGRYAYLAAWGSVRQQGGSDDDAREFVRALYRNVPTLGRGGRDTTAIFLQRGIGDVMIHSESEILSLEREFGKDRVEVVYPTSSVLAENPVAIVRPVVEKKGTAEMANAYLNFLYSEEAQEIAVRHALRPRMEAVLERHTDVFRPIELFRVDTWFGSLDQAQREHFDDGGEFDRLYELAR